MRKIFTIISALMLLQIFHLSLSAQTPSITCPGNITVSTAPGYCTRVVNNIDPVVVPLNAAVSYTISGPLSGNYAGSASGTSFPAGVSTVIYSLRDYPGVTCSFTVTVVDNEPPVISCPINLNLGCEKEIPPLYLSIASATDNCTSASQIEVKFIKEERVNQTCFNHFTLIRTYMATDDAGNTSTCSQVINVNDNEAPHFNELPPTSPLNVSCYADVPIVYSFTGRDNCTPDEESDDLTAVFREVKTPGSCENKYTLTRTWTLSDHCGNTSVFTQVINVNDTQGPAFNGSPVSPVSVSCASAIPAAPLLTAIDNCGGEAATVTLSEVRSDEQCVNKFKLTRTWIATDACGNTSSRTQIVFVNDNQAPVFDGFPPTSPIAVSCTKDIPAAPAQTATDNCVGAPTISLTEEKSNVQCTNRYTLTRKWIASDACGNTAGRMQVVIVNDNEPPEVTEISATSVVLWPPNHKMRDVTINYTASDNCEVTSTLSVTSSDPVNGGSDGDQSPDWEIIDDHHVRLRAEKANNGQARYYTIGIHITDGCNTPVDTSVTVVVAHNITSPQTGTPYKIGSNVSFSGVFWDKPGNKHTAKWLLDGSSATNGSIVEPSGNQNGKVTGNYKFNAAGIYKLQMNVTDQNGITSYANTNNDLDAIVVIYDPNGGYAYGGGYYNSPVGALKSTPSAEGKASYGFTVNYFKNSTNPKGETQFEFKVGDFEFNALNFDYLVISNSMAQFKGTGKIIGGQSGVGFTMTVTDGDLDGTGVDKIRMKIYNKNNGMIIYDNQPGASDAALPTQAVGVNSTIVISGTNSSLTSANTNQKAEMETKAPEVASDLAVAAFPNPSTNNFTINVNAKTNERITMQVVDMYGRIIEIRNVNANTLIRFGDRYNAGTYFVRVIQGKDHKEIRLVKLSD